MNEMRLLRFRHVTELGNAESRHENSAASCRLQTPGAKAKKFIFYALNTLSLTSACIIVLQLELLASLCRSAA